MTCNIQRVALVAVGVVVVLLATVSYDTVHASAAHNRSPRSATMPPSCGCLADRLMGRLLVKELVDSDNKMELLLLHHFLHQSFLDDEIQFAVDLVTGLLTFELMPKVAAYRLRRLALVIDIGTQLSSSSPLDRRSTAALIYIVDTESKNVWNIGSEVFGSEFGDLRRRFELNRCSMNAGKHHPIAKLGWLHYIKYRPISPLLLMLTGKMCEPVILADALHLAFIRELVDRASNDSRQSSILRDAVILRHYLQHQNQGILTDVGHVHRHVLIAAGLFFKLMFPEADPSGPIACCSPSQWQGSAIKSETYTIVGQSGSPQTVIMDNIAIDHEAHAVAGSYYNLVDGVPSYNTSFLMLSTDDDQAPSAVIYIVDIATQTCVAANFTGFSLPHKCLSEETANYTGQITLGDDQLELYGWSTDINSANLRFQGTFQRYVSLIDSGRQDSTTATCVPVFEFSDWSTKMESVSAVTLIENIKLSVAEGAFDVPSLCANTEINYIPQDQLGDTLLTIQKFLATLGS